MNMCTPTMNQFTAYQEAFDYFNQTLFNNTLPQTMLNFSRHKSARAFFAPRRWKEAVDSNHLLDEISLNPDHLGKSLEEVLSSLVHEMVHMWQHHFGEHVPKGNYHNKEWASVMNSIGLKPVSNNGTETGARVSHTIIEGGEYQTAFNNITESALLPWRVFVNKESRAPNISGKTRRKKVRLECSCGNEAFVWEDKTDTRIMCGDCESVIPMYRAE